MRSTQRIPSRSYVIGVRGERVDCRENIADVATHTACAGKYGAEHVGRARGIRLLHESVSILNDYYLKSTSVSITSLYIL